MYRASMDGWYLERVVWLIAGSMILVSLGLATCHSLYWLILTALVGVNLIIFALTGFCAMAGFLHFIGIRSERERTCR